jgi:hypothetical protein
MSRTSRVRIVSQSLMAALTANGLMSVDVSGLRTLAADIATGHVPTPAQAGVVHAASRASSGARQPALAALPANIAEAATADRQRAASRLWQLADDVAVEQRNRLADALTSALTADGWAVTTVDGGAPGRFTGVEATRGDEHLLAAVGAGELLADQAGAADCRRTLSRITDAVRGLGVDVAVIDDVEHDGSGGALYTLPGGPTRAHAIQASLRHAPHARTVRPRPAAARPVKAVQQ